MALISALCLFSEDIREEKSGQDTIVGTLPDNVTFPVAPPSPNARPMMPKLAFYLRMNLDSSIKPKDISAKILNTDGTVIAESTWDRLVVDKAFDDAASNKMLFVSLILKAIASPLAFPGPGIMKAVVNIDGQEHIAGALNIIIPSATASEPLALQSPTAP
jgi:hypothetical protein